MTAPDATLEREAQIRADAELVAEVIAWRCSPGAKPDGSPRAPVRHAIIWQAARLGAIEYAKMTAAALPTKENPQHD